MSTNNIFYSFDRTFYHSSGKEFPVGTILCGRGEDYHRDWVMTDFYQILEENRPSEYIPHKNAVFFCDNDEDLDCAGGATEWVFEVEPIGIVSRHDLNWSSEISSLLSDGYTRTSDKVIQAAKNYWFGVPHFNESVWEYIAPKVMILSCEPY